MLARYRAVRGAYLHGSIGQAYVGIRLIYFARLPCLHLPPSRSPRFHVDLPVAFGVMGDRMQPYPVRVLPVEIVSRAVGIACSFPPPEEFRHILVVPRHVLVLPGSVFGRIVVVVKGREHDLAIAKEFGLLEHGTNDGWLWRIRRQSSVEFQQLGIVAEVICRSGIMNEVRV